LTDLSTLAATAPRDATLVVFHTAVLAYVIDEAAHFFTMRGNTMWIISFRRAHAKERQTYGKKA
jgi:uncharacterized DUF497 family protein